MPLARGRFGHDVRADDCLAGVAEEALIGAISGAYLAPTIGRRGLFLVGLAPAVLVLMIRYWVPESPRFLMRMGGTRRRAARSPGPYNAIPARSSCQRSWLKRKKPGDQLADHIGTKRVNGAPDPELVTPAAGPSH
jgi:hypothetical protein